MDKPIQRRLTSRLVLDKLDQVTDPKVVILQAVEHSLQGLETVGKPAWDTMRLTVALDDTFVDNHVVTITALEDL